MNAHALRLFVYDLAAADRFYGGPLGLVRVAGTPASGFCVYAAGALQLVVETVPPEAPEEEHALVGRFTGLSLAVDDIEGEHRRLSAAGVFFSGAPERQAWGGVLATFVDPAENQLQLVQLPSS
jgi:catechol 2,3-dioxygenase-like lactoylglutathione lyase family enzyme